VTTVANLTRQDGEEFLRIAAEVPLHTEVQTYPLNEANTALDDLRAGRVTGAAVLVTTPETLP
jgi:propanol-preferring alcohol dehydrogenase